MLYGSSPLFFLCFVVDLVHVVLVVISRQHLTMEAKAEKEIQYLLSFSSSMHIYTYNLLYILQVCRIKINLFIYYYILHHLLSRSHGAAVAPRRPIAYWVDKIGRLQCLDQRRTGPRNLKRAKRGLYPTVSDRRLMLIHVMGYLFCADSIICNVLFSVHHV